MTRLAVSGTALTEDFAALALTSCGYEAVQKRVAGFWTASMGVD